MERSGRAPTAFSQDGWPGGSCTEEAPAAAAERICYWIISRYIRALAHISVYTGSQNVCRLDVSFLPRRLWQHACWVAGKEGPAPPALAAAQVWLWRVLLAISRMLCSITVSRVMLPTVSDLGRKSQARREVARHPPFSRRDGWSGRSGT